MENKNTPALTAFVFPAILHLEMQSNAICATCGAMTSENILSRKDVEIFQDLISKER